MNFKHFKHSFFAVLFLTIGTLYIHAQETTLVGFLDNTLVSIEESTAEIEEILEFNSDLNVERPLTGFTFSEQECVFYGIENSNRNRPVKLVKFDLDGNYEVIDTFSIENGVVWICESVEYNPQDQKLYAAVSLNGGVAMGDFFSEAIVEVDPMTANCTYIADIGYNNGDAADIDDLIFVGDDLYIYNNISSSQNISRFYRSNFSDITNETIVLEPVLTDRYYEVDSGDLAYANGNIYFNTIDSELYAFNVNTNTTNFIGQTHDNNDFNGEFVRGIAVVPNSKIDEDLVKGTPKAFTYQGLATDTRTGRVIRNRDISIEASLIQDEPQGQLVYTETHDLSTDNFGFFSTAIGAGIPTLGNFADIDWSRGCYFLQISIDVRGGSQYRLLGVTQLLSVPYALYADQAGSVKNNDVIMQSPNGKCWKMGVNNDGQAVFTEVACQ